ncbi:MULTISPECIES: AAA family ATPase [Lapidilactobacillus]|uniref:Nuclease SbcCD subunit C n=1 Tax=Lapidilactobacillus achengensis TaxID=2486000 RepID=A0ABW1UQR7_9LACO|nr:MULTISPECIES: ATP-binding protein [Lapidilactobacillus]
MTVINLQSMTIHHFKGIKDFSFEPKGNDAAVLGQNASGKTTIFDAFTWLLFGKNSEESKAFHVKPLAAEGTELLGLEPEVTATLKIGAKNTVLKRVLKEVWTKPNGELKKVRKPDKTLLYVDDVPQKVKEYEEFINKIIDVDTFKALTNPAMFTNLKWDQQRAVLMQLISGLTDQDVINKHPELKDLSQLISDSTIEDQNKRINDQRRQIKRDIDALPARIDEATRAIPETVSTSPGDLEEMKATYQSEIDSRKAKITELRSVDTPTALYKQIAELKLQAVKDETKFGATNNLHVMETANKVTELRRQLSDATNNDEQLTADIFSTGQKIEGIEIKKESLLKEYHALKEQSFDESAKTCPTCHRELPDDEVAELIKHFNTEKSEKLEQIVAQGKQYKSELDELRINLGDLKRNEEQSISKVTELTKLNKKATSEYESAKRSLVEYKDSASCKETEAKIADLQNQINNQSASQINVTEIEHLNDEISQYAKSIADIETELAKYQAVRTQQARLAELEADDARLKAQYNELDKQSYLIERFMRAKITMTEDSINQKFSVVKFKLFENQKNGELKETCEATVNGVPFSDLNNAARINAGLDIINTLTDFYDMKAPIFIDNAESVNHLVETGSQQISLVVSEDKKLKVVA